MKKVLLVVAVGVILGGVGVGAYLAWSRSKVETKNTTLPAQEAPKEKLLTWTDSAGFSFQYPDGLTVNKHDEDKENYAHIELTNKDYPGGVIVWAKDTTAADVTAWAKTEKRFKGANILDSTLAGLPAKKVLLSDPSNMLIVGTVDSDIIWTVETSLDEGDYWSKVHDTIAGSFAFTPQPGEKPSGSGAASGIGSDNAPADEEEVIQ